MMDLWANDDVSYDSLSCAISALALPGVGAGPAERRGRRGLGWSVRCGHTPGPSGAGWVPSIRTEAGHNLVVVARPWGDKLRALAPFCPGWDSMTASLSSEELVVRSWDPSRPGQVPGR